jgi:hypothetical protein
LGDANSSGTSLTSNRRITFAQGKKDHLFFIYSFFAKFCSEPHFSKPSSKSITRPGFENSKGMWVFQTPHNIAFNEFYELFYGPVLPKGKRRSSK